MSIEHLDGEHKTAYIKASLSAVDASIQVVDAFVRLRRLDVKSKPLPCGFMA